MSLVSAGRAGLVLGALIAIGSTKIVGSVPRLSRKHAPSHIAGKWHGWSIYLPVDGFFFEDREAIYRTEALFEQRGQRLIMHEQLTRIFDIDGGYLANTPARAFTCKGKFFNQVDAIVSFGSRDAPTSGTMYLAVDATGNEIYGMLVVRPRMNAKPVAVKILLRRADATLPTLEELGVDKIRRLCAPDEPPAPENP